MPVTDDAPALWDTWVGHGGEGIVLKERTSVYRPGVRSPAWLKLKPKLTLEVVVTGGSAERVRWGPPMRSSSDLCRRHAARLNCCRAIVAR